MKRFLIVLFTLLVTTSGHAAPAGKKQAPPQAPARPVVTEDAPVVLDGVELFLIPAQGPFPFTRRTRSRNKSPSRASRGGARGPPRSGNRSGWRNIQRSRRREIMIMVVTDQDAEAEGKPRPILARDLAGRINAALETHRAERKPRASCWEPLRAAGHGGPRSRSVHLPEIFPLLYARIDSWRTSRIPSIKIQSLES